MAVGLVSLLTESVWIWPCFIIPPLLPRLSKKNDKTLDTMEAGEPFPNESAEWPFPEERLFYGVGLSGYRPELPMSQSVFVHRRDAEGSRRGRYVSPRFGE